MNEGQCPQLTGAADNDFCTKELPDKTVLSEGTYCGTLSKSECGSAVLFPDADFGTASESLFQECVWDDKTDKCTKEKNDGGYDVVYICSNTCMSLKGRESLDNDAFSTTCNTGINQQEPNDRLSDKGTCESFYYTRDLPAGTTYFPCTFQGVVDGVANPNCDPSAFCPNNAADQYCVTGCNCVAGIICVAQNAQCCKNKGGGYECVDCGSL